MQQTISVSDVQSKEMFNVCNLMLYFLGRFIGKSDGRLIGSVQCMEMSNM